MIPNILIIFIVILLTYYNIRLFKAYNLMYFKYVTELHKHCHNLRTEYFHHLKLNSIPISSFFSLASFLFSFSQYIE